MCIVCGRDRASLLHALVGQYGTASPGGSRFVAEEIEPATPPSLDPTDLEDLKGPADVILHRGPILTLRGRDEIAGAIAVRAGRIQAVGDEEAVLALRGRLTRIIDLDGRALLPGFVLADWHAPLSLLCDWLDARETPAGAIAAAIAGPSGEWLALTVDAAADDRTNSAIVAAAARPAVAVDPTGSILAASPAARALAPGLDPTRPEASSSAAPHVSAILPSLLNRLARSRDPLQARLSALLGEAARHGVTMLRFCGLGALAGHDNPDLVRLSAGAAPPLRLRGALDSSVALRSDLRPSPGGDMFRIDTAAHWIDAANDDPRELAQMVRALRRHGWRVTLHAESPTAVDLALDAFSAAARSGTSFDVVDGIERRGAPPAGAWARIRELGVSAGVILDDPAFPSDQPLDLDAPSDVPVSLAHDMMSGAPEPLRILATAAAANAVGSAHAADRLRTLTVDAAARCGARAILGALEVGKYADFAFLDRDPRSVDLREAGRIECLGTWLAGREIRP